MTNIAIGDLEKDPETIEAMLKRFDKERWVNMYNDEPSPNDLDFHICC